MMRLVTVGALAAIAVLAHPASAQTAGHKETQLSRRDASPTAADEAPAEVAAGATVRGSNGQALGQVVGVSRGTGGRIDGYLIRLPDGSTRLLPADAATVQGGVLIAAEGDFRTAPATQ